MRIVSRKRYREAQRPGAKRKYKTLTDDSYFKVISVAIQTDGQGSLLAEALETEVHHKGEAAIRQAVTRVNLEQAKNDDHTIFCIPARMPKSPHCGSNAGQNCPSSAHHKCFAVICLDKPYHPFYIPLIKERVPVSWLALAHPLLKDAYFFYTLHAAVYSSSVLSK